jgi:hypothetical protein
MFRIRLREHVRFRMIDMLLLGFQGFAKRKNKFPVGDVMVMLLVPLAVLTPPLADQLAGKARLLFCCKRATAGSLATRLMTLLPEWMMVRVGSPACLRDGNQAPETAGQRIIAAGHRAAGIRLADGAGDLIGRAGAGAAAAGDFKPVDAVCLREADGWNKQTEKEN